VLGTRVISLLLLRLQSVGSLFPQHWSPEILNFLSEFIVSTDRSRVPVLNRWLIQTLPIQNEPCCNFMSSNVSDLTLHSHTELAANQFPRF